MGSDLFGTICDFRPTSYNWSSKNLIIYRRIDLYVGDLVAVRESSQIVLVKRFTLGYEFVVHKNKKLLSVAN